MVTGNIGWAATLGVTSSSVKAEITGVVASDAVVAGLARAASVFAAAFQRVALLASALVRTARPVRPLWTW